MPPISKEAILMAALMMLVVVWAQSPAAFPDMSAEMVSSANGHQNVGHFYTSKGKVRVESSRGSVMIFDSANRTGWLLNPRQRTAMDMSSQMKGAGHEVNPMMPQGPVDPNNPCAASPGSTCKKLGQENVNGRQTQRWEVKDSDGKTVNLWIDASLRLAVKTQTDYYTGEFRNIKEGPQPSGLFEVPTDYRKMPAKR